MKTVLLDTNIVVYVSKDVRYGDLYRPVLEGAVCLISFITVAEMYEGAFRGGVGTKTYQNIVKSLLKYETLPLDLEVCKRFGQIRAERRNKPISVPDALVAATALAYDLPLVTHNAVDFEDIQGLNVITKYKNNG